MNIMDETRIFIDAHAFDPPFQSSQTFVREITSRLAEKPGILLFIGAYDLQNVKKHFPNTTNIIFLKYHSTSRIIRLLYDVPMLIKKHRIEYAHFQYFTPLIKNCKLIVTIHDVIFSEYPAEFSFAYRNFKKRMYKWSAHRSDFITTVSEYSKKSIQKYLNVKKQIYLVPNGVSARFFEPYDKQQAIDAIKNKYGPEKFILLISRMEPRKNHLLLLQAFLDLELHKKGYSLVCIGHRSLEVREFDDLVESLSEEKKKYIFVYDKMDTDLLDFYRAASAFVYPSKAEGFGLPPVEAAAVRIPVLCSNTSAMKEFSFFGKFHVDPEDKELFKKKLLEIIEDPYNAEELQEIADIVKDRYSWSVAADKLFEILTGKNTRYDQFRLPGNK